MFSGVIRGSGGQPPPNDEMWRIINYIIYGAAQAVASLGGHTPVNIRGKRVPRVTAIMFVRERGRPHCLGKTTC